MIAFPAALKAVGGARSGVAPMHLLDVQDVNGNLYYWSDRRCEAPVAIAGGVEAIATPPVAPANGQVVAWAYPSAVASNNPGTNGTVSDMTLSGAKITMVGPTSCVAQWSGFKLPALPSDAVIQAIYGVVLATANGDSTFAWAGCGTQDFLTTPNPAGGAGLNMPIGPEFDGEYFGSSVGTAASALTGLNIGVSLNRSLGGSCDEVLTVSFVGLAIYYTTQQGSRVSPYLPWLLDVPQFSFHRSLQTDTGSFVLQNVSGDTLSRDMEKILRASTLEGALFVYRLWQADAEAAWLEVHGTLTLDPADTTRATLKGSQLINPSQDDTPLENYCETCQIDWAGRRCGSTQPTECSYSFQSCQVVERIMVVLNNYEKNFGEATANITANRVVNRRRKI